MADSALLTVAASTLALGAPLVLAAMGGYASERSGVINIALEGKMLSAACAAALVGTATGSPWLGLAAALVAGVLLGLLHWLATQSYRVDPIISGMAVNLISLGAVDFAAKRYADPSKTGEAPAPAIAFFYVLAVLLPLGFWWWSRHTRGGLHFLASGSDPEKARQAGLEPIRIRAWALVAAGVCCGLAGAMLVANVGTFTASMTAGRGYIALAALILGGWRPLPALAACLAFGLFDALQLQLQGTAVLGISIPAPAWSTLPYLVTLIALAGFLGKNRAPAGLGKI